MNHLREYATALPDRKLSPERTIADGNFIAVAYDFAATGTPAHGR
ncbi:hypothetical protein [Streptomyces sp. NPDC053427]